MGELIIIAIVALLALGPEKLPSAAKTIGKTIRDLRKSTTDLKRTIEKDTQLGDAMREIRSAFEDDPVVPPRKKRPGPEPAAGAAAEAGNGDGDSDADGEEPVVRPADGAVAREDDAGEGEPAEPEADKAPKSTIEQAREARADVVIPEELREPSAIDMSEYQRYVHMWGPAAAAEKYGTTLEHAEAAITAVVSKAAGGESSDG